MLKPPNSIIDFRLGFSFDSLVFFRSLFQYPDGLSVHFVYHHLLNDCVRAILRSEASNPHLPELVLDSLVGVE
jgi:hypothetical protein